MRRSTQLLLASLLALTAAGPMAGAAVRETPQALFTGRDLFGLEVAADPQIRPDGDLIAYVRATNDIMVDRAVRSIWLVDAKTGSQTPLVSGPGSAMSPRWSPDGQRLAYVQVTPDAGAQLYVQWVATGRTARLATLEEAPSDLTWSPDGKTLAFTMLTADEGARLGSAPEGKPENAKWAPALTVETRITFRGDGEGALKPGFSKIYTVSAEGGAPRQLTFGKFDDRGPLSFTKDGRYLLFSANRAEGWERNPAEAEIWRLTLADGALKALTSRVGPDANPVVSPDGRQVAYLGYDDTRRRGYENQRLYVMDIDGGGSRVLTGSLDRSVDAPVWSADGRSLYVTYDDHGVARVARVGLMSGEVETVVTGLNGAGLDRPYSGGSFSVARDGTVAFTQGATSRPSDIAVVKKGGEARRLTALNADLLGTKTLGKVEALPVKSSYDGKAIDAWIVTPPNFDPAKKYPLILEIHGGPFSAYGPGFSTDYQLYAAAGYVVVYSNPRGSTSYGEAFANEIDRNYPSHDYDDLMSAVDAAVAKGFIDSERLYVTGGSGGGALTAWIVGKTNRFAAAATQKPVINWTSQVLTTDAYNFMASYWFGKMPWEDPQGYWARSPLSLVGNVKTPTLVVVGDQDLRTPVGEAEQYYQALQLRGVPTALVKVPGASHGGIASRPSQSAAKASAILAWFEKFKAPPK
ncbi:alpha/beta hydrolase family protein [Caulobacter hibisci]|uniref:S9 family peptidase n=1 Tax=Caulobacter hibisci TaxID=2035993 RepID=A0ABS0T2D0_9CAUL|nr:S9 family peptidase [Caulobacter hibisci]MBI1686043.1 S9 family peptidase [Caulobacter hibisci]